MKIEQFVFWKESESFEGSCVDEGKRYNLSVCNFEAHQLDEATALAEKTLSWLAENIAAVKQFAAAELLEVKNNSWLEGDDQPVTVSAFVEAMELTGIAAFHGGRMEICFDDGGLFWEHVIMVSVNENLELESADIAG